MRNIYQYWYMLPQVLLRKSYHYKLLKKNRCAFDPRPPKHWYHTLGFGPFVEGFHVSDHYNVNDDLESFRGMKRAGIVFG